MQGKERTLGELFAELTGEMRTLLQKEMELARTEVSEIIARMLRDAVAIAAGGIVALVAFMVLVAAAVFLLGEFMPLWGSALLVGIVLAAVGFILIRKGQKDIKQGHLAPETTAETLKETAKWAKAQMK